MGIGIIIFTRMGMA